MFSGKRISPEFTAIVKEFYPALCLVAERITHDLQASEEIVQDVMVRFWQKQNHQDIIHIKAFLYRATKNASIDYLRSAKLRVAKETALQASLQQTMETASRAVIEAETRRLIHKAINKLPNQCGKVIRMIFQDGMSHGEVAEQLGVTESTVRNLKAKGILLLRRSIPGAMLLILLALSYLLLF